MQCGRLDLFFFLINLSDRLIVDFRFLRVWIRSRLINVEFEYVVDLVGNFEQLHV